MANNKVLSLMGFAARAGKIVSGYNAAVFTISRRKGKLLLLADDLSENTKEKMSRLASRSDIPYRVSGTIEEMSHITGEEMKGIFVLTDKGFAEAILKEIDEVR